VTTLATYSAQIPKSNSLSNRFQTNPPYILPLRSRLPTNYYLGTYLKNYRHHLQFRILWRDLPWHTDSVPYRISVAKINKKKLQTSFSLREVLPLQGPQHRAPFYYFCPQGSAVFGQETLVLLRWNTKYYLGRPPIPAWVQYICIIAIVPPVLFKYLGATHSICYKSFKDSFAPYLFYQLLNYSASFIMLTDKE
jgi:hypothetical protein